MAKVLTYVSSNTYDTLLNIMYPDDHATYRSVQEVERLIIQGHTVEYRFGSNLSTVLDMDRFNEFIRPKYADDDEPRVNTQEVSFQKSLEELVPKAPEINIVPKVGEEVQNETIDLQPFRPFIPETPKTGVEETKTNNNIPEENKEKSEEVKEESTENKDNVEENKSSEENKEDNNESGK